MARDSAEIPPRILVVEDDLALAKLYATWLGEQYDVAIATDGNEALSKFDATVDVVLLDRRLPGASGDSVLERLRERGVNVRIAMVTAVVPDFDIIEMGFDDYLRKPADCETLLGLVEQLIRRANYDAGVREQFATARKLALLESTLASAELAKSAEYSRLREEYERREVSLSATAADFDRRELAAVVDGR
ncbi:MAG: response regulator [Halobacteriales archaeon]|nr:response regulator [Halobacteriales archaeon]